MKTASTDPPQGMQTLNANALVLVSAILLVVYIAAGKVWGLSDVWTAVRGIALLWLPVWLFLFVTLKDECADNVENGFLSAVGSLALTTGLAFAANMASVWWSGARHATWLVPLGLFVAAVWRLVSSTALIAGSRQSPAAIAVPLTKTVNASSNLNLKINQWMARLRFWRPDWALLALIVASLCVTARYQRPFEPVGNRGDVRYVLNGDQTYFTSLAYELTRNCPPADCPYRSGVRERAYHSLPHLTLALFSQASGETDLLRSHLVVGYSALVVLCCGLVFCLSRELGGCRAAGLTGLWLLFVGAIPTPMLWPNDIRLFYFTVWPQSSSTIEPTLLTSPQMFYGVTIVFGVLLGLVRVSRSVREGRSCLHVALVTALLAALLLRFRVQCFIVIFALVGCSFVVMAVRHRRWQLIGILAIAVSVALLQFGEMKLPAYLPTSQTLRIGNNGVGFLTKFFQDWPGAQTCFELLHLMLGDSHAFGWSWQMLTLSMFVALNMLGLPMLLALVVYVRGAWRNPQDRGILYGMAFLAVVSVFASATLAMDYDGYSVGGQILLHFGWFALPCVAVGVWRIIAVLLERVRFLRHRSVGLFCLATLPVVIWQMVRPPSASQEQVCCHTAVITADEVAAWEFCRRELPADAVLLTNKLETNMAKWAGLAGRRSYLDYLPASKVLDPLLPVKKSVVSRSKLIEQLFQTTDDERFEQLLRNTPATHLVEFQDSKLRTSPAHVVRPAWQSLNSVVTIWQVIR